MRLQTAEMMGEMIRDGYPATAVLAAAFKNVATNAGEKHGGGALNLVSGVTTGDMFTPPALNTTGFHMNEPYSKVSPNGWSVGFPEADNYQTSPIDGSNLTTVYAYQALKNAITVTANSTAVHLWNRCPRNCGNTQEIVQASV